MWKVQYKHANAASSWITHGKYGSEPTTMNVTSSIAHKHFALRVLDPNGHIVLVA
jgi:hypothetical protein